MNVGGVFWKTSTHETIEQTTPVPKELGIRWLPAAVTRNLLQFCLSETLTDFCHKKKEVGGGGQD